MLHSDGQRRRGQNPCLTDKGCSCSLTLGGYFGKRERAAASGRGGCAGSCRGACRAAFHVGAANLRTLLPHLACRILSRLDYPKKAASCNNIIGPHGLWLIPLATTLGGLISGLLVYNIAPEAEGHGTDTVVKAFHRAGGFIRARVAPLKLVASAITIGSGGSAGREGPTALIGAGVGSIYATVLGHRRDEERGLLVLMGMAAGLSAIFRSPIGAAFFAVEVLYGNMEFEAGALLYTMLASIVAYGVNGFFVGWQPLFYFPSGQTVLHPLNYAWFGVLGAASGLIATLLPVRVLSASRRISRASDSCFTESCDRRARSRLDRAEISADPGRRIRVDSRGD